MTWQDAAFSIGSVVFIVALVPALRSAAKPPRSTSVVTATVLTVYAVTQASLGLLNATVTTSLLALAWFILAFQGRRR